MLSPGSGVVVDVHAAGVSFPEVLQTRGEYQMSRCPRSCRAARSAGTCAAHPKARACRRGTAWPRSAPSAALPRLRSPLSSSPFPFSDALDFAQGAGLILNYHTAWFALRLRGRLAEGETVVVHGAAGGVGTVAHPGGEGPRRAHDRVVSTDDKETGGP